MENFLNYSMLSLIGVQFLGVIFGVLIYTRQKSALGLEMRDRGEFRPVVQRALSLAADALAGVERIDVEQYRSLAKKLGEAHAEIESLKAQLIALKGSIESAHNKLAGYAKLEKRAAREEAESSVPISNALPLRNEFEIPPGVDPLEWMKSNGLAQPLQGQVAYQQQKMPLIHTPKSFGKQVRG